MFIAWCRQAAKMSLEMRLVQTWRQALHSNANFTNHACAGSSARSRIMKTPYAFQSEPLASMRLHQWISTPLHLHFNTFDATQFRESHRSYARIDKLLKSL